MLARRENQAQRKEKAAIEAEISKNVEKYRKSDLHKLTSLLKKMRIEFEGNTRFKQAKEEECRFFKNEVKRLKDQLDFDRKMHKLEIENNGHVPYGEQNQIYNDNELLTKTDDNLAQSINNYMLVFLNYLIYGAKCRIWRDNGQFRSFWGHFGSLQFNSASTKIFSGQFSHSRDILKNCRVQIRVR